MNIYNFDSTLADALIAQIESESPKDIEQIKELYEKFNPEEFLEGEKYYRGETKILTRKIEKYENGSKSPDDEATNKKIVSGLHKILVDQKTAYLSGEPMSFGSRLDNSDILMTLQELIGERWEDTLPELIKEASNKGKAWLHPFVNEDGEYDYMIIGAEQLIPIYDSKRRFKLTAAIRFYAVGEDHVKLEFWTDLDVTYYEMIDGELYLDVTHEVNPAGHFSTSDGGQQKTWERVPFIKFSNNAEELSDLHFNKSAIDEFEELLSDGQNTLSDMQSLIYVLKGYEGESLSELMTQLKRYKAVSVDENGGVDTLKAEVPTEAYKLQVEILRKMIVTAGQGVDPSPEVIGQAPSGVALNHLYALLDMKASIMERKFTLALREFMYFIRMFCELSGRGQFDDRDITFTFNKMLLTNEAEIIQMARDSVGIISETTILENHPWVSDIGQEQERLAQQKEAELSAYDSRYGDLKEEEDE